MSWHLVSFESHTLHLENTQQSDSNCIAIGEKNKHNHCVYILVITSVNYAPSPDQNSGDPKMHLTWLPSLGNL